MTDTELKALAQKATPGEWYRDGFPTAIWANGVWVASTNSGDVPVAMREANAAFIAAANPATVLDLLTRLERAKKQIAKRNEMLAKFVKLHAELKEIAEEA